MLVLSTSIISRCLTVFNLPQAVWPLFHQGASTFVELHQPLFFVIAHCTYVLISSFLSIVNSSLSLHLRTFSCKIRLNLSKIWFKSKRTVALIFFRNILEFLFFPRQDPGNSFSAAFLKTKILKPNWQLRLGRLELNQRGRHPW